MASVKGLTINLDMNTSGVTKSFKGLNKDISATGKQVAAFSKGIKLDPKNLEVWKGKQTALNTKLTETNQKLNNLKAEKKALEATNDGSDKWKANMKAVDTEIQETTNNAGLLKKQISGLESEMKKVALSQTTLGKMATGFETAGTKAVEYGNKMKYVSLAAAGVLAGIAKLGISFNDAFSGVEKTVDERYVGEYEKLKNSILEMSKEIPKSVETLSQAMELGGQLGIDNSNLESFTKTMVNLEVATNMTTEEASTMAAQFANITKMNQKDFERFGSTIVDLGNNFATTEKDVMEMSMRLASAGNTVGMSQPQILAMATSLSSVGVSAEVGGSAFSKLMLSIQESTAKGGTKLNEFAKVSGMGAEQFKKAWAKDSGAAMEKFIKGMGKMKPNQLIKTLDKLGIKQTAMKNAIMSSAKASDVFSDAQKRAKTAWKENTALTTEASKKYETFQSKLTILGNKVKATLIKAFEKMTPTLNSMLDGLTGIVDGISNFIDNANPAVITAIAGGLAAVAVAAPGLIIVGKGLQIMSAGMKTLNAVMFGKKILETASGVDALGTAATETTTKTGGLVGVVKGLGSRFVALGPAGWAATAAVGALGVAVWAASKKHQESIKAVSDFGGKIDEVREKYKDYKVELDSTESVKENNQRKKDLEETAKQRELSEEQRKEYYDRVIAETIKGEKAILDAEKEGMKKAGSNINKQDKVLKKKSDSYVKLYSGLTKEVEKVNNVKIDGLSMTNGYIAVDPSKTEEEKRALKELNEMMKKLPEESRVAFVKNQKGLNSIMQDGKSQYFLNGKDVTEQMLAGYKSGLLSGDVKTLVTSLEDSLTFDGKKMFISGQEVSTNLFKGLSPDEIKAKAEGIKSGLQAGFQFEDGVFNIEGQDISAQLLSGLSPEQIMEKTALIKQGIQQGMTFDNEFFGLEGQKISTDFFSGLNPEQTKAKMSVFKSLIDNGLKFENGQMAYKGKKLSSDLFAGMKQTDVTGTVNTIMNLIDAGFNIDLTKNGVKAVNTLKGPISKIDFSQPTAKVKAQLEAVGKANPKMSGVVNKMISDLDNGKTKVGTKSKDISKTLERNAKANGTPLGYDFANGYAIGITNGTNAAVNAASALAAKAIAAAQKKQDSDSPSKVTMKLGGDFGDGYAIGISSSANKVTSAVETVVKVAALKLTTTLKKAIAGSSLENMMGINRIAIYKNQMQKALSQPGLSAEDKEKIKKYWDDKIAEETKNYKRQVEALKREEAFNKKKTKYEKNISNAEKYKKEYDKAEKDLERLQKKKNSKSYKKMSASEKKKLNKQIADAKKVMKANANNYKKQTGYNIKTKNSLNTYKNKQNGLIKKEEQIYKLNDNIAKSKEQAVDWQDELNKSMKEGDGVGNSLASKFEAMNEALKTILDNNVLEKAFDRVKDIAKNINLDTGVINKAIKNTTSNTINDNRVIHINVDGSNVDVKDLAKELDLLMSV